jgi:hypothetical protein
LLPTNINIEVYRTLPVVKIKSSTLMEDHRLRVFENRGLGGIFGLNRDMVRGE